MLDSRKVCSCLAVDDPENTNFFQMAAWGSVAYNQACEKSTSLNLQSHINYMVPLKMFSSHKQNTQLFLLYVKSI